jgi:hypothetical protein
MRRSVKSSICHSLFVCAFQAVTCVLFTRANFSGIAEAHPAAAAFPRAGGFRHFNSRGIGHGLIFHSVHRR